MARVLLNGREPADWELAAIARAVAWQRERDARVLAGCLAADAVLPEHAPRPVTDLLLEFS